MEDSAKKLMDWMSGEDTGVSSLQIARRHLELPLTSRFRGTPSDADDFGRCYRLLKRCPEIKISCMLGFNRIWDGLVKAWPELTRLYEAGWVRGRNGNWGEFNKKIREIEKPFWQNGTLSAKDILYGENKSSQKTYRVADNIEMTTG